MRKIWFGLLLLSVVCRFHLAAQAEPERYNFSQFTSETWDFVKQPTRWGAGSWLTLALSCAGAYWLLKNADQRISNECFAHPQYLDSAANKIGKFWGGPFPAPLLMGIFALHAGLSGDRASKAITFEIAQATIYTVSLTFLIKVALGRARPGVNEGVDSFRPFSEKSLFHFDYQSFPGGHTSAATAISTILADHARPWWLKVVAYVPAALCLCSRVYENKHWTSDVFFGAVIGYSVGKWLTRKHKNKEASTRQSAVQFRPFFNESLTGHSVVQFRPFFTGSGAGLSMAIPFPSW